MYYINMARRGGSDSGMMIMVVLLLLLSFSASAGIGGYFYMNQEDPEKETEDKFKLKYQEAVRALEAEQQANTQLSVAKSALELAQEELEIARLAFEGKEFANEAEKSAARQRLYVAEQAVDTAAFRLSEAETNAQTAETNRNTAEADADSALDVATKAALRIERLAVAKASALVTEAQGELDAAKLKWEEILGGAKTYAEALALAGDADRRELLENAKARYDAAVNDAATAKKELETAQTNLEKKQTEAEAALINIAETYATSGICKQGRCPNTLTSPDGRYKLQMQGDGNLVIYEGSTVIWAINKFGTNARLEMQGDGNLVVYADQGVLWASGSNGVGVGPYELRLQSDRNLVIYDSQGSATWNSGTQVQGPAPAAPAAPFSMPVTGAVTLKGGNANKYCADEGNKIICNRDGVGMWETYGIQKHGDKYALRSGNTAKYCADEGDKILCNRDAIGAWEKYGIEAVGNNKYAIKSNRSGKYCADEGNNIICNRDTVGDWEKFTIDQAHPVPTLMGGQISWQNGGAAERGGLIWKTNRRTADWNTKYKFRCAGNGGHSAHTTEFGPVSFSTSQEGKWANPKIRVALDGQQPCPANYKLEIFEGNENITSQMKNFDEVTAYDGTDRAFYDPRNKHGAQSSGGGYSYGYGAAGYGSGYGGCDPKLKDGINKIGTYEGLNVYEWTWNDIAMTTYGLKGREVGFLTTELDPEYVGKDQYGYEYIKDGTKISEALKTVRATMK